MTKTLFCGIIASNKWGGSMNNHEVEDLMVTTFLGYKYRKQHDLLYSLDGRVPISLINMYYSGQVNRLDTNSVNRGFIERYVENESVVEDVHDKDEVKGLAIMYKYMQDMKDSDVELFSLGTLHRKLFSIKDEKMKNSCEMVQYIGKNACNNCSSKNDCFFGGKLRNSSARIKDFPIELSDHDRIYEDLIIYEEVFNNLKETAIYMRENNDYTHIISFVRQCVILKCHLIKIHPFGDGNGRTIRCLINKLFEIAGIPPVYISKEEKTEYKRAMNEALRYRTEEDYSDKKYNDIIGFYLYKICDSIIELDINKRIRAEREEKIYDVKKKTKKKNKK